VAENWLDEIHREFTGDPSLFMLGGRVLLADESLQRATLVLCEERGYFGLPEGVNFAIGANMAFRRELFDRIGLFDVRLGPGKFFAGSDDVEFVYRGLKSGCRLLYAPNVLVYHNHDRVTLEQVCQLEYGYAKSCPAYLIKHSLSGDDYAMRMLYWTLFELPRRGRRQREESDEAFIRHRSYVKGLRRPVCCAVRDVGKRRSLSQTMSAENIAKWREALLLPGETDPAESGVRELAEYFGVSREEATRACRDALGDSKREWESAPRRTPDQIVDFYRRTRSYLFEHVWWHATDLGENSANVEILNYASRRGARAYLDFGSGVGSNAILFARHGFEVALADVSETMLDFARWRLERRGLPAEFINLNLRPLPRDRFDFATAVDVCEHLTDPQAEFRRIAESLKLGGAFVFNQRVGEDAERPMHILTTAAPILRSIRQNGLREAAGGAPALRKLNFYVVERDAQSRIKNWLRRRVWFAETD
jgi:2-polyprenyl-3-methyl-5-hydroxy-6-metoxy-1,4-benzoquinol methylase